ncbi:MAG: Ltp family lipoprotein [Turicibacter sp.]|nr:Ltp family lipoprotein [Turicibacter sp.]
MKSKMTKMFFTRKFWVAFVAFSVLITATVAVPTFANVGSPTLLSQLRAENFPVGSVQTIDYCHFLNVRRGPGLEHAAFTFLSRGTQVTVLEYSRAWVRIDTDRGQGWISAAFLSRNSATFAAAPAEGRTPPHLLTAEMFPIGSVATVDFANSVNVRRGAGNNFAAFAFFRRGDVVTVLDYERGWVRVDTYRGEGWMFGGFLSNPAVMVARGGGGENAVAAVPVLPTLPPLAQATPPPIAFAPPVSPLPTPLPATAGNIPQFITIGGEQISTSETQLSLPFRNISDIEQLRYMTNLTELDLSDNNITDISPLAGLTNLRNLQLSFNPISEITALSGLTNLTRLGLNSNPIFDIAPLAGLTNLTILDLFETNVSNLTPLTGLTNLNDLYLSSSGITDISPLANLPNLRLVELAGNITDWSPVDHIDDAFIWGRPADWVRNQVVQQPPTATVPAPQPEQPSANPTTETAGQTNARLAAQRYLEVMSFSRQGLIDQLIFDNFTFEDSVHGVDSINANWNEQAIRHSQRHLDNMSFSRQGLINQLVFENFTVEEATHGVDSINANWSEQAAQSARRYLDLMPFSRQGLIDQLIFDNFTNEQAIYGVNAVGL